VPSALEIERPAPPVWLAPKPLPPEPACAVLDAAAKLVAAAVALDTAVAVPPVAPDPIAIPEPPTPPLALLFTTALLPAAVPLEDTLSCELTAPPADARVPRPPAPPNTELDPPTRAAPWIVPFTVVVPADPAVPFASLALPALPPPALRFTDTKLAWLSVASSVVLLLPP
jgi:hypothetical protein